MQAKHIATALILIALIGTASAAEYYVDAANGNDSNPGTSDLPWETLDRAYTWYNGLEEPKVQEGDTVFFRNGNYGTFAEDRRLGDLYYFIRTGWVTYKAAPGHMPELNNINVYNAMPGNPHGSSYLIFDGFKINDGAWFHYTNYIKVFNCRITTQSEDVSGYYEPYYVRHSDYGIYVREADYITIENNEISHAYQGIQLQSPSNHAIIRGNTIHYIAGDGISVSASDLLIEDNIVYDIDCRRTTIDIRGTVSGTFTAGELVTQAVSNAEGIYHRDSALGIYAYITTEQEWVGTNSPDADLIGDIAGETSGATVTSTGILDPIHSDCMEVMAYRRSEQDIIIRRNFFYRLIPSPWMQNSQVVKLDVAAPSAMTSVTVENNVFIGDNRPLLLAGIGDLNLNNNVLYGQVTRLYFTSYNPSAVITNMYNNIFTGFVQDDDDDIRYCRVINHSNNIFGNNPDGSGGPSYPFEVNTPSELINYDIASLFEDLADYDLTPKLDSIICNGSHLGTEQGVAWAGALPCPTEPNPCANGVKDSNERGVDCGGSCGNNCTFYLDAETGSGSGDGTSQSPWQTIAKAQENAIAGDTVLLRTGNYGQFSDSVERTDWLTWKADTGASPVFESISIGNGSPINAFLRFESVNIDKASGTGNMVRINSANSIEFHNGQWRGYDRYQDIQPLITGDNIVINGIEIFYDQEQSYATDPGAKVDGIQITGQNFLIENCNVHDFSSSGIQVNSNSSGTIQNCHVYDARPRWPGFIVGVDEPKHGSGIAVLTENLTIRNNIVHACGQSGGHIFFYTPSVDNVVIENNLLYDGKGVGMQSDASWGRNSKFNNNTVVTNWEQDPASISTQRYTKGITFRFDNYANDFEFYNNIIIAYMETDSTDFSGQANNNIVYSFKPRLDWVGEPLWMNTGLGSDSIILNSDISGHGWIWKDTLEGGDWDPEQDFFTDPDFTPWQDNSALSWSGIVSDFSLKAGSPAIGFGSTAHYTATDIEGNPRDALPDAGAYEFQGTTCVDTPALLNYISEWKQGQITMLALMQKIAFWKAEC